MQKNKSNYKRQILKEENLLQYRKYIKNSARNITITEEYMYGRSYRELAEEYDISEERVSDIISNYIRHCHLYLKKTGIYADKE